MFSFKLSIPFADIPFDLSLVSSSVLENAGFVTVVVTPAIAPTEDIVIAISTSQLSAEGMYF